MSRVGAFRGAWGGLSVGSLVAKIGKTQKDEDPPGNWQRNELKESPGRV